MSNPAKLQAYMDAMLAFAQQQQDFKQKICKHLDGKEADHPGDGAIANVLQILNDPSLSLYVDDNSPDFELAKERYDILRITFPGVLPEAIDEMAFLE